jgi:hypothetical protein
VGEKTPCEKGWTNDSLSTMPRVAMGKAWQLTESHTRNQKAFAKKKKEKTYCSHPSQNEIMMKCMVTNYGSIFISKS